MIRNFYCIGFLVLGMGLPVLAKTAASDRPTLSTSSKAGSRLVPTSSPLAKAKEQDHKKSVVTVTPDTSRGAVSPALLAKQQAAASAPVPAASSAALIIRNSTLLSAGQTPPKIRPNLPAITAVYESDHTPIHTAAGPLMVNSDNERGESGGRLARVTAYWAAEGDYYTERCMSATGVRLHDGHCAVDPTIIPYGSVVTISGVGHFLAVDTGSAVINRTAAREGGHTDAERHAIVVDVFFEDRSEGERFAAGDAKYVSISWYTPTAMNDEAKTARSSFADENWTKIEGKQL